MTANPAGQTTADCSMSRIVNRVTTLHRPLPADASFTEIVAYWQKRIPGVDMYAIADKAITETWQQIGEAIGLDMQAIDEGLQTITDILADEAQQEYDPILGDFLADAPETEAKIAAALYSEPSEPVMIGKTWRARRRDWAELAVRGVLVALIVVIGALLAVHVTYLVRGLSL